MWPNPQETEDLYTFTEAILDKKNFIFVQCSVLVYETSKFKRLIKKLLLLVPRVIPK